MPQIARANPPELLAPSRLRRFTAGHSGPTWDGGASAIGCGRPSRPASSRAPIPAAPASRNLPVAALIWLRPYLPAEQINSYIAGLILLAAAPCTAMVFVWSNLSEGEPHFTLSQVALAQPLVIALLPVPILIQVYFNSALAHLLNRATGEAHCVAAPSALIGASNFFELAVAAAISLFGFASGAALATVVGVLIEVPVMLSVVTIVNATKSWYERGAAVQRHGRASESVR